MSWHCKHCAGDVNTTEIPAVLGTLTSPMVIVDPQVCEWTLRQGNYLSQGHGQGHECSDFETAKERCLALSDCAAIATQSNVCGGQYRLTHCGSSCTFNYYGSWSSYNLNAYSVDRSSCESEADQIPYIETPMDSGNDVDGTTGPHAVFEFFTPVRASFKLQVGPNCHSCNPSRLHIP